MADHITNLVEIYNRWLDKDENKNVDKGSADEVLMFDDSLTEDQQKWLKRFCDLWEEAYEHEYLLQYFKENKGGSNGQN